MCQICLNPAGEKSCCCFNLSLGLVAIAVYFGVVGGLDIYQSQQIDPYSHTQYIAGIVNCSIAGYICLCVLLGYLKMGIIAYVTTFAAFVVTLVNGTFRLVAFIMDWVQWGKNMSDGTEKFQWVMLTSSVTQLLTIAIVFGCANLFWSAACVYKAGGNGCEFKSYREVEMDNKAPGKKQDDADTAEV
ncbi:hypothetical protein Efla_003425 [Eimeria flavescens]